MAGQGTATLELFQDIPAPGRDRHSGGWRRPHGRCSTVGEPVAGHTVVGVEADTANDTYLSLKKGERVTIPPADDCDGIRPQSRASSRSRSCAKPERVRWSATTRYRGGPLPGVARPRDRRADRAVGAAAVLSGKLAGREGRVVLSGGTWIPGC